MPETPLFHLGPLPIATSVVTSWGILLALLVASWAFTRRLERDPGPVQAMVEGLLGAMDEAVRNMLGERTPHVFPFLATLWIYLLCANLAGLIPGLHAPTADLSVTTALAVTVFAAVHVFGIRMTGWRTYFSHYMKPVPLLLPFHLLGELSRTLALAVRLFGNMMSLQMAAMIVLLVAGILAPVPLLLLHLVEALIQSYIFGMLALIYIAGGIHAQDARQSSSKE